MRKRLKGVTVVLLAVYLLSVVVASQNLGPLGVDVVSAATTGTTETTQTTSKTTNGSYIIKLGSQGSGVKLIQSLLNSNGYILKVDGIFGNKTLAAVKDYQSKNGLIVDGIVGSKTYEKLNAEISASPDVASPEKQETEVDAVTTASIVNEEEAFLKAISKDGTWIIATLNDLTFDEELVLEGEFRNKGDATKELYRKLAPYTQDEEHNVTERFTITAPKLTIKSPNAKLQGGIFVGDVYVEANGFVVKDAKIDGNVYFANEEYKASFDMSDAGEVTGVTEVKN